MKDVKLRREAILTRRVHPIEIGVCCERSALGFDEGGVEGPKLISDVTHLGGR